MGRRLAALLFAAIFLPTLAMLGFMDFASARALAIERSSLVTELRDELMSEYVGNGAPELTSAIRDRVRFNPLGEEVISYADPSGKIVAGNLPAWPQALNERARWLEVDMRRPGDRVAHPVLLLLTTLPDRSRLVTGYVVSGGRQLSNANRWAFLLALAIAGPLALGLVFVLLRIIEGRVTRIAGIAERVGEGDLSQRVDVGDGDDAFSRLGRGFNGMLDKIEALVMELRLVTDGLAHDLRSPITRLQSVIERAAVGAKDAGARAALESAQQEAEGLQAMLTAALQISRAEAGIGRDRFTAVDLAAVLDDLVEIYGPAAEDGGFVLTAESERGVVLPVHRELLGQALGNLVENALRHADGGSRISLKVSREREAIVISVADDGAGIPADRREEALRRFGRLDHSRHAGGHGLGLALVEATARLHGGAIELGDARPGLIVRLVLPIAG